jgi:WD40 repeat protein
MTIIRRASPARARGGRSKSRATIPSRRLAAAGQPPVRGQSGASAEMSVAHQENLTDGKLRTSPLVAGIVAAVIGAAAVIAAAVIDAHPATPNAGHSTAITGHHTANHHATGRSGNTSFVLPLPPDGKASSLAFSPDNKYVAAGDTSGRVDVWQVDTHALIATTTDPSSTGVTAVAFNPAASLLASADNNGHIYLWAHKLVGTLTAPGTGNLTSLAFSPDNKYVAAGDTSGRVDVWAVTTADTPPSFPGTRWR